MNVMEETKFLIMIDEEEDKETKFTELWPISGVQKFNSRLDHISLSRVLDKSFITYRGLTPQLSVFLFNFPALPSRDASAEPVFRYRKSSRLKDCLFNDQKRIDVTEIKTCRSVQQNACKSHVPSFFSPSRIFFL
jgi:hypothetical protein